MEEKIGSEITRIEKEFKKWDAAAISVRKRIKQVQIQEYLKEVQKMILTGIGLSHRWRELLIHWKTYEHYSRNIYKNNNYQSSVNITFLLWRLNNDKFERCN